MVIAVFYNKVREVDLPFVQPSLTVRQVEEALGVTYSTALQYVRQLEGSRVLREITGRDRNRVYLADQVLEAIGAAL